jgi:serine/threonine protein kinase
MGSDSTLSAYVTNDSTSGDTPASLQPPLSSSGSRSLPKLSSELPEIEWPELAIKSELGRGNFGKVYRAFWRGEDVAVKTLKKENYESIEEFKYEAMVMKKLKYHPRVIQLIGISTKQKYALISQFCENGSLYDIYIHEST